MGRICLESVGKNFLVSIKIVSLVQTFLGYFGLKLKKIWLLIPLPKISCFSF